MSNLPDLPLDMWREILLWLPGESLFRFRTVCKRWRKDIDDPNFARAHNNNQLSSKSYTLVIKDSHGPVFDSLYSFDLNAVNSDDGDVQSISGYSLNLTNNESLSLPGCFSVPACYGLMLVTGKTPVLEIWNISTHERLLLPRLNFHLCRPWFAGLGYDHAAQDFKAVAIQCQHTFVYSLRSDTWTKIGDCPCKDGNGYGVFVCGALHWLSSSDNKIVALDLGTEKHRIIRLHPLHEKVCSKKIDVLEGCLVLSGFSDSQFEVWVMKDYGSDDESWTKLLSIKRKDLPCQSVRPLAYIKEKKQVFLKVDGPAGFVLFDVESKSMKRVRIDVLNRFLDAQIIPRSIFRFRDHFGGSEISRIKPLNRPTKMKVSVTINT